VAAPPQAESNTLNINTTTIHFFMASSL